MKTAWLQISRKPISILVILFTVSMVVACSQVQATTMPTPVPVPPTPTWTPAPPAPARELPLPDVPALRQLMLDLINADRAAEGLAPVQRDPFAETVAQSHADELVVFGYMSHWNLMGEGPDLRYGRAGGTDFVMENLHSYWYRYSNGDPAPIEDWEVRIIEAQEGLMQSAGHRENIMSPPHTHVGIGIAYDAASGELRIAQEFIRHYADLSLAQISTASPESYRIEGTLTNGATNPLINLGYEPFPAPLSIAEAESRKTYSTAAEFFHAIEPDFTNGQFSTTFSLPDDRQPGVYHIWLFATVQGERVTVGDVLFEVK